MTEIPFTAADHAEAAARARDRLRAELGPPAPRQVVLTDAELDRVVFSSGLDDLAIGGEVTILPDYRPEGGPHCLAVICAYDGGPLAALRLAAGLGATLAPDQVDAILASARIDAEDSHTTVVYFPACRGPIS